MYAYAYVQRGVVLAIEHRTIGDSDTHPIAKYYHGSLLPFFIEIRPGDNAPTDREVSKGWVYHNNQFAEPAAFDINPETGEMYLPPSIPAEQFWQIYQDNIRLSDELEVNKAITNQLLLDQLTAEGAVIV